MKFSKGAGIAGGIYTTRVSYLKVYSQFQEGGWNEVFKNRDILDATVGSDYLYDSLGNFIDEK